MRVTSVPVHVGTPFDCLSIVSPLVLPRLIACRRTGRVFSLKWLWTKVYACPRGLTSAWFKTVSGTPATRAATRYRGEGTCCDTGTARARPCWDPAL